MTLAEIDRLSGLAENLKDNPELSGKATKAVELLKRKLDLQKQLVALNGEIAKETKDLRRAPNRRKGKAARGGRKARPRKKKAAEEGGEDAAE